MCLTAICRWRLGILATQRQTANAHSSSSQQPCAPRTHFTRDAQATLTVSATRSVLATMIVERTCSRRGISRTIDRQAQRGDKKEIPCHVITHHDNPRLATGRRTLEKQTARAEQARMQQRSTEYYIDSRHIEQPPFWRAKYKVRMQQCSTERYSGAANKMCASHECPHSLAPSMTALASRKKHLSHANTAPEPCQHSTAGRRCARAM
jgi:hypothetical protein